MMKKIKSFFAAAWQAVKPGPRAVKGAALGILIASGALYFWMAVTAAEGPLLPGVLVALYMLVMGGLLLFLGQGLAKAIELLASIPWSLRWALLGGAILIFIALMGAKIPGLLVVMAAVLAGSMALGGGAAALLRTGWRNLTPLQRGLAAAGAALGALALIGGIVWYGLYSGFPEKPVIDAADTGAPVAKVNLPDPSLPGPYAVETLTYGSGTDRFRAEYGAGAAIQTSTVDGSVVLEWNWTGPFGQIRSLYWGFDPKKLPVNGRVWYPAGKAGETFPLVLAVHGNHLGSDFSDPGYAYLGELLASRGYIFASVDENFLNGLSTDLFKGFSGENDARAWMLLEHLRVWSGWNGTAGNPFYQKVDLDHIALIGHSRGGEAVAVAAAFNRLPYLPDNASLAFDYNFNIQAVVAIAPIDGQYVPAWKSTPLSDINYFVIQGSHDSDLTSFDGLDPYERVKFSGGEGFKAALYIYRANHGQFNSVWGNNDIGMLRGGFLNRAALLSGEEQAQIAKVYISAFLEAALRGQRGYLPLFQDARVAGEGWLPDTIYINRLDLAGDRLLATFEEDINLQTASVPGASIRAVDLKHWREQRIEMKWGGAENSVAYLSWNDARVGLYTLTLPESGFPVAPEDALIFNLADANQDPAPEKKDGDPPKAAGPRAPLDLTVTLEDAAGQISALPLSRYKPVQPQLTARLYKLSLFEPYTRGDPVMQSYAIPLADFKAFNSSFDPARLRSITFLFDQTKIGSVVLDGVGVRPGR